MYGHLTCPEIFWHVSDKRIGLISNPDCDELYHTLKLFALYRPLSRRLDRCDRIFLVSSDSRNLFTLKITLCTGHGNP